MDRGTEQIWKALKRTHEAKDTILVFVSDNGFFAGQHRLGLGKILPYVEATRVPFAIRLPKRLATASTPGTVHALAANIDIAPTLLDYASATPCIQGRCRRLDGRSLRPLLTGAGGWPAERTLVLEFGRGTQDEHHFGTCQYEGVRRPDLVYIRYNREGNCGQPADERELYDLAADPFELVNRAADPAYEPQRLELHQRLHELRRCTGIAGRDPAPPGGRSYCE